MDFCAVLISRYKANVTQFRGHFAFVAEAMGLNIRGAGEYNSGQQSFAWRGGPVLKHLR